MLELCMSGQVFKIFLRSSLAQIMNAFIGLCEHVLRIFKPILDSLLLPRVHCLLRLIKIRDQSTSYLDMWSSVSLSFWLSDDLSTIFAWGATCLILVVCRGGEALNIATKVKQTCLHPPLCQAFAHIWTPAAPLHSGHMPLR